MSLEDLAKVMPDPLWRLDNLYSVIDEQGQAVPFRLRPAQKTFIENLWYFNIVLKARQLGFTTLIDLLALDMTIFNRNFTSVIIAETKDKAADIFESKVMYPYQNLPKEIREWCPITSHSALGEVHFGNGGCIKVMVSARSGTCQFLHVSEYGPVCAKQPAKAKEIRDGSLPSVHAGGWVFIESTAMGNSGYFYDLVQQAKAIQLTGRKLGQQEYRLHFHPWWANAEYAVDSEVAIPARLLRYFDELYARQGIALTEQQMAWYALKEEIHHEEIWAEYPSFVDEAFRVAQEGAYYKRAFERIYRENRITTVAYDQHLPVYTAWDLGVSDETSIWFFQLIGKEIRVIDYYANNGEGIPHYAMVLREKGYQYARHFAPHDIAVRELGTGVSRMETARLHGIDFDRIPTNADLMGGIENVRDMLNYCWFDESKTEEGRKCLESYKKEWDEKHGCFKTKPLHDWASHGADSFRTMAQAWKMGYAAGSTGSRRERPKVVGGLKRI